jgi:hypothetical protein
LPLSDMSPSFDARTSPRFPSGPRLELTTPIGVAVIVGHLQQLAQLTIAIRAGRSSVSDQSELMTAARPPNVSLSEILIRPTAQAL